MRKNDLSVPALLLEAVTILLAVGYIGLQIIYGLYYHRPLTDIIINVLAVVLVYAGLTLLSIYPEWVNALNKELCQGMIRLYTLRMVRLEKFIFIVGLLVPCIFDVVGVELPPASSLILAIVMLVIAFFYEARIIKELREMR